MQRANEAAARFDQSHHRFDHRQHIALDEQFAAVGQGPRDRLQQVELKHPAFVVLGFEPGIGKLDRDPLQQAGRQGLKPGLQAHIGIAEEVVKVFETGGLAVALGRFHQGPADLHP